MKFVYRGSVLKENSNYFVVSATYDLSKKEEKYHSEVDFEAFRKNQPK
jgi:UDP-N-acetylenolpyruvoylglucosamine reductase